MDLLLIWIAKVLQKISRLFGNSGAALPGLFLERVSPDILERRLAKIKNGIIVISGTNGKTTTTKIISESLSHLGWRVLTNTTGSNMTRGLISTVVSKTKINGSLPYDTAVLEIDEAYAALLAKKLPIRGALVLNVMRDQLDRFGEIDTTSKLLGKLTGAAKEFVVLNARDKRVADLPTHDIVKRVYFGYSDKLSDILKSDDDWHDGSKPKNSTGVKLADILLIDSENSNLQLQVDNKIEDIVSNFNGAHNHCNVAAALAVLRELVDAKQWPEVIRNISSIHPAFGRGETISIGKSAINLLLVKNPSSFVTTLNSTNLSKYGTIVVAINDAYADGQDVSWLWDVDVTGLTHAKKVIASGTRAYDMALRLKYEDKHAEVIDDLKKLLRYMKQNPNNYAVLCTYTAMMQLRKRLAISRKVRQVK